MVLLAAAQPLGVREMESAASVRACQNTVRCWLQRSGAHGIDGLQELQDPWAGGAPAKGTPADRNQVLQRVRRRPRRLDLPSCTWTLQRLADVLAERTGIGVHKETVRAHRLAAAMVLRRPQPTIRRPDPEYAGKQRRSRTLATD